MIANGIPKEFNIFGQHIKVKYSKVLHRKQGARGFWDPTKNTITIQSDTKEYPVSRQQMEQTFIHEMLHACLDHLQYETLSQDEEFVEILAQALHQVSTSSVHGKI